MAYRFRDRLSDLPDEILHHIFLFDIDTKQLGETSILSKRWRNLWCGTHTLNFDCHEFPSEKKFIDIMNTLLAKFSKIDKFSLSSVFFIDSVMDEWVSYAVSILQTTDIHLTGVTLRDTSKLGYIKSLRLDNVTFRPPNNQLVLSLRNVESLTIKTASFSYVEKMRLDAPLLKYLIFHGLFRYGEPREASILAPNLTTLEYRGAFCEEFHLHKFTCLVNADVQIDLNYGSLCPRENVIRECLEKILLGLCNVKSLILNADAFQSYAELPKGMKSAGSLFKNLKYLKLTNWREDGHIVALMKLLAYFPFIETLVLERAQTLCSTYKVRNWESQLLPSCQCKFNHLKTMEVQNIDVRENNSNKFKDSDEYTFLEFMMARAPILHTVIIRETRKLTSLEETQLAGFCRELQKETHPSVTIVFRMEEHRVKVKPVLKRRRKKIRSDDKDKEPLIFLPLFL